jgi:hypothetical protein
MSKDIKILNEVHKMKNLMKYMNGEKISPKELKEGYYEESEMPLEEGVSDDYSRDVKVRINAYRAKFNGNDIDDVEVDSIKLSYAIDIEAREWGIKGISLYGIEGPSEIEGRAIYYPEGSDDPQEAMITLLLNWENVNIEKETGSGIITVGDEIEITLANNEKGELFVSEIMVPVYTL